MVKYDIRISKKEFDEWKELKERFEEKVEEESDCLGGTFWACLFFFSSGFVLGVISVTVGCW